MKENQSTSHHFFPNYSPQKVQHQKYTATISTPEKLQREAPSNFYTTHYSSPNQSALTSTHGAELSQNPHSSFMGPQHEIEHGRNLLFSDNSTINQQTSSLKSSEHSLNDGFCEDFSQGPKENNSNGQIELGNTSKILEPTILYPVHDIRTQLLSPETQPRKKDHDSHRDNPGTSHSSPGSLGFPNLGNTCYMNSVLQCLINNEKLYNYFIEGSHLINKYNSLLTESFVEVLSTAFAKKASRDDIASSLFKLKHTLEKVAPIFEGYAQNDAHEFFRLLIEKIHDELNYAPKRTEPYTEFKPSRRATTLQQIAEEWYKYSRDRDDSIITSTFGGILLNEVICTKCRFVSHTFEDALDLSLDLINTHAASSSHFRHHVKNLETCLQEFITNEFIEGYVCAKCKKKNTSLKKTTIWKQPETLVVQFKRFIYDNYGDRHAVKDRVAFPLHNMSLDAFLHERSHYTGNRYRLYGIINHFGGLDNGHYIALIYNEHLKEWLQYNDSDVTRIHEKEVKDFAKGSKEPYILFYKKC